MKSTVIPAQITTVEDKIAGNLNLTQIVLFLGAIFLATVLYVILPPFYHLAAIKVVAIILVVLVPLALSIRLKGKIILDWLLVLSKFNLRPKYYVFDKNDAYLRTLYLPEERPKARLVGSHQKAQVAAKLSNPNFEIKDLIKLENLISNKKINLSFRMGRKGGLDVALEQV